MTQQNLSAAILRAIDQAIEHDAEEVRTSQRYAADLQARRLSRAETLIAALAGKLDLVDPALGEALNNFLDTESLEAAVDKAKAQARHLAGSDVIRHPAPGERR